jgi:hypothetical protein
MRALLVTPLVFVSCFSPIYEEGGLACGPGGACPGSQTCKADNHCWSGTGPTVVFVERDAGVEAAAPLEAGVEHEPLVRQLGDSCSPAYVGLSKRSDDCAPGLVCVQGNMGSTCFQLCAGGELRNIDPGGPPEMVCPLPPVACDPVSNTGCQPYWTCYRQAGVIGCDPVSGGQRPRESCTYSRDCFPGLECVVGYCAVVTK